MPCTSGPDYEGERKARKIEAAWCAILTVLENNGMLESVLTACDWEEAGVTNAEVLGWWAEHKQRDRERRAYEKAERRRKELKTQALGKLTPEERKALKGDW